MVFVAIHAHTRFNGAQFAIDTYIKKALFANGLKQLFVVSFALLDERSQKIDFSSLILLEYEFENLFFGVFHHLFSTQIRISIASSSKEQTEEVVDFRDSAHRGTRILVGGLLLDADDRR